MKQQIWQYGLNTEVSEQIIKMPINSEILSIQIQNNALCMWVLVDLNETVEEERVFEIYETGSTLNYDEGINTMYFQGTFQINNQCFHVFEKGNI